MAYSTTVAAFNSSPPCMTMTSHRFYQQPSATSSEPAANQFWKEMKPNLPPSVSWTARPWCLSTPYQGPINQLNTNPSPRASKGYVCLRVPLRGAAFRVTHGTSFILASRIRKPSFRARQSLRRPRILRGFFNFGVGWGNAPNVRGRSRFVRGAGRSPTRPLASPPTWVPGFGGRRF